MMTYVRETVEDVAHTIDEDLNEESLTIFNINLRALLM